MPTGRSLPLESLTTSQVLTLYEKLFGRLDPIGRRRMIQHALDHGWDRAWDDDAGLAA